MKNKKTYIILAVVIVLLFAVLAVLLFRGEEVTMNPPGTVGNTAGNLNNSGLFCEYNGTVYFSNSYDSGSLYSMSPDESNIKKISNTDARNILAGGDYLYYFRLGESGDAGLGNVRVAKTFNRCKLNGTNTVSLSRDTVVTGQLVDNYLYLLTGNDAAPQLKKMKIDKSEEKVIADAIINPACAYNGLIYYNGTIEDHYLHAYNTSTGAMAEIWRGNLWNPVMMGDYVYYMDVENDYRLCRYSFSQDLIEVLTDDRVDYFNVGSNYIYYQKSGNEPSLNCMLTDGSGLQIIAPGIYNNINMTSQYVYFQEYGNDTTMYHSRLGSSSYDVFYGAKDIVKEAAK